MARANAERTRKRRRLIMLLASIPVVLILVLVAGKLMSLSIVTQSAISLYDRGNYEASEEQSSSLLGLNIVEPWIPYFNRGDAKAADEDYTAAIDDFEKALELAPDDKKCQAAVNLAHSWEVLGDIYEEGGFHQGAVQLYQAAEDVLASMGDACEPPDAAADSFDKVEGDVADKKAQAEANQDAQDGTEPGTDGTDDKLDDLGDKQEQSDQDKANGDARDRTEDGGDDGSFVEKPW
jgi:tetratricopeptide (TPR) repeat protein